MKYTTELLTVVSHQLNLQFYGVVKRFSHISPFAKMEIVFIQAVVSGIVSGTKDTYYASQTLP